MLREVWRSDADFVGNWHKATAHLDVGTAKSRARWIISLNRCAFTWHSKLLASITLSTTESEYYALTQALKEAIPIMNLLQELRDQEISTDFIPPKVLCKAFKDNSGALELARAPQMRPHTKHINQLYHHFQEAVREKLVSIHPINTTEQRADLFTKPLNAQIFEYLRKQIIGW